MKIVAFKQAQKIPELIRNPSLNPAIHIRPEGPADLLNPPRKRKPFPDLEKFTGDRRDFKRWYFKIFYKIKVNRNTLGLLKIQFDYIYFSLGKAAQNIIILFAEKAL